MDTPVREDWIDAAGVAEFEDTDRQTVDLGDGRNVGIFKLGGGEYAAISIWCSHQRLSLMEGDVEDGEIMCPHHGACFDLRTGKNTSPPALKPIATYEVKVEGGRIFVRS
jgi:3-phenylpropionate/trans-cinnamate dioxygenase ferredoxin subunit